MRADSQRAQSGPVGGRHGETMSKLTVALGNRGRYDLRHCAP